MFSGEDAESSRLEESTWTNSNVRFLPLFLLIFSWSEISFNSFHMHSIYGSYVQKLHSGGRVSIKVLYSVAYPWREH